MNLILALLLFVQASAVQPGEVDPTRVAAELAADADVLRVLRENGDVATTVRPVNVRFVGSAEAVARLEDEITGLGWRVVQSVEQEDGAVALDVERDQTTDVDAVRLLTEAALRIEAAFGVRYDGWGTVAQTR